MSPARPRDGARERQLCEPDRALELVLAHTPAGRVAERALPDALGLWLAADLPARLDQPPFTRALMDGFAVRVADAGRAVEVRGEAAAGHPASGSVEPGTAIEISTGAPCPPGTESVVKLEDTEREAGSVRLPARITPQQHVQPVGGLRRAGETVLPAGTRLGPLGLAAALAAGCTAARVWAPPSLAVITTGDELRRAGERLDRAEIPDSNGPMLLAMARALGLGAPLELHAGDDPAELAAVLDRARELDLVVLSGGVSVGPHDLVPRALAALGAQVVLHGIRQQPGKPLLCATRGAQLVFGLPGTPLGSHLGFHRYVAAAIRKLLGAPPAARLRRGRLRSPLRAHGERTLFRLVRAELEAEGWRIDPLRWRGSSDLAGPALANGYCRFEPGEHDLGAGAQLDWEPLTTQDE
jgi:molybdopterin molybdotransferase